MGIALAEQQEVEGKVAGEYGQVGLDVPVGEAGGDSVVFAGADQTADFRCRVGRVWRGGRVAVVIRISVLRQAQDERGLRFAGSGFRGSDGGLC